MRHDLPGPTFIMVVRTRVFLSLWGEGWGRARRKKERIKGKKKEEKEKKKEGESGTTYSSPWDLGYTFTSNTSDEGGHHHFLLHATLLDERGDGRRRHVIQDDHHLFRRDRMRFRRPSLDGNLHRSTRDRVSAQGTTKTENRCTETRCAETWGREEDVSSPTRVENSPSVTVRPGHLRGG